MRMAICVLGLLLPFAVTQPTAAPTASTPASPTATPSTHMPTSAPTAAPTTLVPTSAPTAAPVTPAGLFGPTISVEYGRPAWSTPTLPASATCPYTANSVGGGRTGADLFEHLLETEGAVVQVQDADTWSLIAARVTAAGLCNATMDPAVSTSDILRYNGLHAHEETRAPPIPGTWVIGCGVDPVLPECGCPTNFPTVSPTDGLTCGTNTAGSTSNVQLNCPQRIISGPSCGNGTAAQPAGFVTTEQSSQYFSIDPAAGLQADLFIDFGVFREVLDFALQLTRASGRPLSVELAFEDAGGNWTTTERFSQDCSQYSATGVRCSSLGLSAFTVFSNGEFGLVERVRLRFFVASGGSIVQVSAAIFQGRCACSGHASTCWRESASDSRQCQCQHNTVGGTCDSCLPMYNDAPFAVGNTTHANRCELCECNGHEGSDGSASCTYSAALDHGVCDACMDNTDGPTCALCASTFVRNPTNVMADGSEDLTGAATCIPCACDVDGAVNGTSTECSQYISGQPDFGVCACKANAAGRACDECSPRFYNLTASNPNGCSDCGCDPAGSLDDLCHPESGQCRCRDNVAGRICDQCLPGFTNLSAAITDGCELCRLSGPLSQVIVNGAQTQQFMISDPSSNQCLPCHDQCDQGCTAPQNASACTACKGLTNGDLCVATCPDVTYPNATNQECEVCHPTCRTTGNCRQDGERCGCSGPTRDDCDQCVGFTLVQPSIVSGGQTVTECLDINATCPVGNYGVNGLFLQCQPCNAACDPTRACTGPAANQCDACRNTHVWNNNFCQDACQTGSWADTSDALNGAPNAQFAVCSACSALCATGCGFPPSVNRSVIAAMLPSTREAVTAAFCAPAGEMGCNPVNSFYSLASTTIGGFPVTGLCVQGSTSNCPANTYFDPLAMARTCIPCDNECAIGSHCTRGGSTGCEISAVTSEPLCANFFSTVNTTTRVGLGGSIFECVASCPPAGAVGGWHELTTPSGARQCIPCNSACDDTATMSNTSTYACTDATAAGCAACSTLEIRSVSSTYSCGLSCPVGFRQNVSSAVPSPIGRFTHPSPSTCQACPRYVDARDVCVASCSTPLPSAAAGGTPELLYDFGASECGLCSDQCRSGCDGASASDCLTNSGGTDRCRNAQGIVNTRPTCLTSCQEVGGYSQPATSSGLTCADCPTACNANSAASCCNDQALCGFTTSSASSASCNVCSPLCSGCTGSATNLDIGGCSACAFAQLNGTQCVGSCPAFHFVSTLTPVSCMPCSDQCDTSGGCTGPLPSNCDRCAGVRLQNGSCAAACSTGSIQLPAIAGARFVGQAPAARASCYGCDAVARGYTMPNGSCGQCSGRCNVNATCTGPGDADCVGNSASGFRRCAAAVDNTTGLGTCVSSCSTGQYFQGFPQQQRDPECQACDAQCDSRGCTAPGPGACVFCRNAQLRNSNGECRADCSGGFYRQSSTSPYCLDCDPLCTSCHGPLTSNCGQDCVPGVIWDDPAAGGMGCSTECSAAKYQIASFPRPTCAACDAACEPSSAIGQDACIGPGSQQCRQCLRFHYFNASLVAEGVTGHDTCVLTCPTGTYSAPQGNSSILRCTLCDSSCQFGCTNAGPAACSSASGQNPCNSFQISQSFAVSPGVCVSACPDGTFADSSRICQVCDPTVCSRCSGPTVSECAVGSCVTTGQNGQCVAQCSTSTEYRVGVAGQYTCVACSPQCTTSGALTGCTGAGASACRACRDHAYDGACFSTCPGYFESGVCVTQCTQTQAVASYIDTNRVCQECHSQCLSCTGPAQADCTTCRGFSNSQGLCVAQCSSTERLVGTQCVACHEQCYGSCTGPSATECLLQPVLSSRGVTTSRRCRGGIISTASGNRTCVATCSSTEAYQTVGATPQLDVSGGFLCRPCETGFRCVDGQSQEPCPFGTVACATGSSACLACPDSNGHCVFNFNKGAMDAVQCDSGFTSEPTTCDCISSASNAEATSTDKSADTNVTMLTAVAVGGVAFLAFVAAFVYVSGKSSSQDMGPHSIANPVFVAPSPPQGYHSPYAPPASPYGSHGAPAAQHHFLQQDVQGGDTSMM